MRVPLPTAVRQIARTRLVGLIALTGLYLVCAEWAAFGRGAFWTLERVPTRMQWRWEHLMRLGARASASPRVSQAEPRLLLVGSSVADMGFDRTAFEAAWRANSGHPALTAEVVWLAGSTLVDHVVMCQLAQTPPPAYIIIGFSRRDIIAAPPMKYALAARTFHGGRMLPIRSGADPPPWTPAQGAWRKAWPSYRYRILAQQLTLRYRPGLRGRDPEVSGMWERGDLADQLETVSGDSEAWMTGADLELIAPWAAWCRQRGSQPVLVAMPVRSDRLRADLAHDGDHPYPQRVRAVAAASGVWFFDYSHMARDEDFEIYDGLHNNSTGAARISRLFAGDLASRAGVAAAR